jgi:hypothetical protein
MTAPAFIYTSEPWAALSFGRPIFAPAFMRGRMRADHLPQPSSASRFTAGAANRRSKMIEKLAIVSTGRNGLFQVPVPP